MKKYYIAILILLLLGIAGSAVILVLSPDTIPVHYDIKGEVDRYGSKYENLLIPVFSIVVVGLLMLASKVRGNEDERKNQKAMMITAVVTVAFFDALEFYLGIKAILMSNGNDGAIISIGKFIGIAMGTLLCLLGNIMPKVRRNSVFGLRTSFSKANDRVWQKSQRFAGITAVIAGLAIIVSGVLLSDMGVAITILVSVVLWLILSLTVSYKFYLDDKKTH